MKEPVEIVPRSIHTAVIAMRFVSTVLSIIFIVPLIITEKSLVAKTFFLQASKGGNTASQHEAFHPILHITFTPLRH